MSDRQQFFEGVQQAAEGTPYVVTWTAEGFDVALEIVDARWFGLFNKAGLSRTCVHHVKWLDDRVFSVTDESRTLEWVAGTPRIAASGEVKRGRVIERGWQKVWAFDKHGEFGVQAEYRFDSEEGRRLITGVAGELGLAQRRGTEERIALAAAAVAIGGLVIGGIVVAVLALSGAL